MTTCHRILVSLSFFALAACGSVAEMPGAGPDAGPDADTGPTAPRLLSSFPADGATGVRANAVIELRFSAPMDQASVADALDTSPFEPGEAVLSWNAHGDTLTITVGPGLALAEAAGPDPSVIEPIAHQIVVGASATDVDGNPLEAEVSIGFTTARRMWIIFQPDDDRSRLVASDGGVDYVAGDPIIGAGAGGFASRSALTFDLSELPAETLAIQSASLSGSQAEVYGERYTAFGAITTNHVRYDDLADAFAAAPLAGMGSFSTNATLESKYIDVTFAVQDDLEHRAERSDRSQYRLQFESDADKDGAFLWARFGYGTIVLTVAYLAD
jgi:hypothetical protein